MSIEKKTEVVRCLSSAQLQINSWSITYPKMEGIAITKKSHSILKWYAGV